MAQAARKVTAKNANEKLANPRLTVPERLGNVAEACRGAMRIRHHWQSSRVPGAPERRRPGLPLLRRSPPIQRAAAATSCANCG
jgi:hypothetical protein